MHVQSCSHYVVLAVLAACTIVYAMLWFDRSDSLLRFGDDGVRPRLLPVCAGHETRIAYLLTIDSMAKLKNTSNSQYDFYRAAFFDRADGVTQTFVLTFEADERHTHNASAFNHRGSFSENRNVLLQTALAFERQRGCRFYYYVFVDDHLAPFFFCATGVCATYGRDDVFRPRPVAPEVAAVDGCAGVLWFEQYLLRELPVFSAPRRPFTSHTKALEYWSELNTSIPFSGITNYDHGFLAFRYDAARWLLPYADYLDPMHWLWGQYFLNIMVTAMYSPWRHAAECVQFEKFEHSSGTAKSSGGRTFSLEVGFAYMEKTFKPSSTLLCYLDYAEQGKPSSLQIMPPLPLGEADVDASVHLNTDHAHWVYVERFWRKYGKGIVDVDRPRAGAWEEGQKHRESRAFAEHPKCPLTQGM